MEKPMYLTSIVRKVDTRFSTINGKSSAFFSAFPLAPLDAQDDEEEEECLVRPVQRDPEHHVSR